MNLRFTYSIKFTGGDLSNTTSEATADMSEPITEGDRVTFPPGDVLNDPMFKKWKVVFPRNETILVGIGILAHLHT